MVARAVDIDKSGDQLAELVNEVENGTHVILRRGNRPVAEIVPISTKNRIAGIHKGLVQISDDFDEGLPEEFWAGK